MGLHTIPDAKERVRARVRKQAFSTLGGSDTAAIQGDTLKNFVKLFDLDIDALLGEHDDGDGALELHEFKQLLTDKPSVDMLPGPSFQPAALVPVLSSPLMSSTQRVFALNVRCLLVSVFSCMSCSLASCPPRRGIYCALRAQPQLSFRF